MSYGFRMRKKISYTETFSPIDNESPRSHQSLSSYSGSEDYDDSPVSTKRTKIKIEKKIEMEGGKENEMDMENPYLEMIKKNIEAKNEMLKALGFYNPQPERIGPVTKVTPESQKKRVLKPYSPLPPREKSLRLQGKRPSGEFIPRPEPSPEEPEKPTRKPPGPLPMKPIDEDEVCSDYLFKLLPYLNKTTSVQLEDSKNDLDSFKTSLGRLQVDDRCVKVTLGRIASLAVHPSETKLLVAAGDKYGCLGLWDVLGESSSSVTRFQPHVGSIHCTSFCKYNPTIMYTTSIEGCVRRCDINKLVFDEFYASDTDRGLSHTTWHCQMDAHTLMVAQGDGTVAFVDSRSVKNAVEFYNCHERSVRTVDSHPLQEHVFATASSLGEVRIWDARHIRKQSPKPLAELIHNKALKNAFFSPAGNFLLTGCNDDRLRVYHVADLNMPQVVTMVKHNMHTGRWLTPFKPMWHPQREDAFIIGSMQQPRRVEVFGIHGKVLHSLYDLSCVLSCCQFHPTQLAVVGANSSGKAYAYLPRNFKFEVFI